VSFPVYIALFVAMVVICFKPTLRMVFIVIVTIVLVGSLGEIPGMLIVVFIFDIPVQVILQSGIYRYISTIVVLLPQALVVVLIRVFRTKFVTSISRVTVVVSCIAAIIGFNIAIYYLMLAHDPYSVTATEWGVLVGIIVLVIIVIIIFIRIKQIQKRHTLALAQSQVAAQTKHIQQLMEGHQQIRKMAHNFKHSINMLHFMATENRNADLLAELQRLGGAYSGITIVETGNIMLDAVLSTKREEAQEHGIAVTLKLNVPAGLNITTPLCMLLSNALDNAIEACNLAAQDTEKIIEIEINAPGNSFMCRIRNTLGIMPQEVNGVLQTHKPDKLLHGLGMSSMKQTAEELGGDINWEWDSRFFVLYVSVEL